MKKVITALAGLATAGAAFTQVDPTHLMIIGLGNANAKPGDVIVTNQTAPASSSSPDLTTLEKFVVTGSLIGHDQKAADPSRVGPAGTAKPEGSAALAPTGLVKSAAATQPSPVRP